MLASSLLLYDLVTFDGDVTLYDDGNPPIPDNPVIPRLLSLLKRGIRPTPPLLLDTQRQASTINVC